MPVVMEIAYKRYDKALIVEALPNFRDRVGCFGDVDCDSYQFRPSLSYCSAVAAASAVSVIVIDCTTTGAPPPT